MGDAVTTTKNSKAVGAKGKPRGKDKRGKGNSEMVPLADDLSVQGDDDDDDFERAERALLPPPPHAERADSKKKAKAAPGKRGKVESKPSSKSKSADRDLPRIPSFDGEESPTGSVSRGRGSKERFEFNPVDEEAEERRQQNIRRQEGEM